MKRLVIDIETTGLSPRYNKVLTVGMLLVDVEKDFLKVLDENHVFIKHDSYNSTKAAMKVNKIDLEKHNLCAVSPDKACDQINSFVDKNSLREVPLVGHNFHFDKGFLAALFDQGESSWKFHHEHEDTMWMWRNLQKSGSVPFGVKSSLQAVSDFFKIDYTRAHDALADCHITSKVYHKLLGLSQ